MAEAVVAQVVVVQVALMPEAVAVAAVVDPSLRRTPIPPFSPVWPLKSKVSALMLLLNLS